MDTPYVMFDCSAWTEERKKMGEKCEEERGARLRTVRQLMDSRKETPAVLNFIAATLARQRTQRKE